MVLHTGECDLPQPGFPKCLLSVWYWHLRWALEALTKPLPSGASMVCLHLGWYRLALTSSAWLMVEISPCIWKGPIDVDTLGRSSWSRLLMACVSMSTTEEPRPSGHLQCSLMQGEKSLGHIEQLDSSFHGGAFVNLPFLVVSRASEC